jgi:putative Mg2+ transporter-C (MgtC) family protein
VAQIVTSIPAQDLGVFLARALCALAFGALIGAERQWRSRNAGLRTNALVALGAALFELLALALAHSPTAAREPGIDFTRVSAYIVSGIGFLGAGVIIRDGVNVRGINTAATIWCSAAVGALAGMGYLPEALLAALLVVAIHLALRPVALALERQRLADAEERDIAYRFEATCRAASEAHVRALVTQAVSASKFRLRAVASEDLDGGSDRVRVYAELHGHGRDDVALEDAVSRLSLEPAISAVSWRIQEEHDGESEE